MPKVVWSLGLKVEDFQKKSFEVLHYKIYPVYPFSHTWSLEKL